jgi:hypothetical protein
MKLLTTLALCVCGVTVSAQLPVPGPGGTALVKEGKRKHPQELQIGYGFLSWPYLDELRYKSDGQAPDVHFLSPEARGPYTLSFGGFVARSWSVCFTFVAEWNTRRFEKAVNISPDSSAIAYLDYRKQVMGILAQARYHWLQQKDLDLYSGLGFGWGTASYNVKGNISPNFIQETAHGFGFQCTAAGLRYGRLIGVFAEAGYGHLGILHVGLNARFY